MRKKKKRASGTRQVAELPLQIGACAVASVVVLLGIFVAWLAHEPYATFIEFISNWKTVSAVIGVLSVIATAWAFAIGWDPKARLVELVHRRMFSPLMRSKAALVSVCAVAVVALAAETAVAVHLLRDIPAELDATLYGEYDAGDRLLSQLPDSDSRKAAFLAFNGAMLQDQLRTSNAADATTCEGHVRALRSSIHLLEPLYHRYIRHRAEAACYWVASNPRRSLQELERMTGISRFLGRVADARSRIAYAIVYISAGGSALGMKDDDARQHALDVLSQVDLGTETEDLRIYLRAVVLRLRGNVAQLSGNPGEAIAQWQQAFQSMPADRACPHHVFHQEFVRLHTNRVLGFAAAGMVKEALDEVPRAKPVVDKFLSADTDSHRATAVRLYSNGSVVAATTGRCDKASELWNRREEIKKQSRGACTSLLETTVLSCGLKDMAPDAVRRQLLANLAFSISAENTDAVPDAPAQQQQLLSAASKRFSNCYLGLTYPREQIALALGLGK